MGTYNLHVGRRRDGKRTLRRAIRSPLFWAGAYLALIPGFGFVYSHQTGFSANEAVQATDVTQLTSRIERYITDGCGNVGLSYIEILGPGTNTAVASFDTVAYPFPAFTGPPAERADDVQATLMNDGRRQPVLELIGTTPSSVAALRQIFDQQLQAPYPCPIPESAVADVQDLYRAFLGDATAAPHSFFRMTYFSMITVATIGYGDIIPTTDTTRLLVAIQVIAGFVIAGLFLFTLTTRLAELVRRDQPPSPST